MLQYDMKEFYEIGRSLTSEKDTMKLLDMIINSSMRLTSSDAGTIYLIIDKNSGDWSSVSKKTYSGKLLKFAIAKNSSLDIRLEESTSAITRESIFGHTVITGKPLRINDAYNLNPELTYKHNRNYDSSTGYMTKSILTIPMKDHDNNITGVIQLINKKKDRDKKLNFTSNEYMDCIIPYDKADVLIMNSLAGQAAAALENNLLYRDLNNLLDDYKIQNNQLISISKRILKAHEEERKRIAREIHDGPAQSVVNLSLKTELCRKYLKNGSTEELGSELKELVRCIQGTSKEIRTIIYDLKPSYLEDGLIKAIENRIDMFRESTGMDVALNLIGDDSKIEYYMSSTIYRIIQEALSNIMKHACASTVSIDFHIYDRDIRLKISDNGKGFEISTLVQKSKRRLEGGFGLEGIRERIQLLRGSMELFSAPQKSTGIDIHIPL